MLRIADTGLGNYCLMLIKGIPHEAYIIALIIFCIGSGAAIVKKSCKEGLRWSAAILLAEYVFMVLGSTVLFRQTKPAAEYNFTPFWSYYAIHQGWKDYIAEDVMNAVVFIPIGFLAGVAFRRINWKKTICFGLGLSSFIETMQFVLKRGFSEFDDIIHNTLGCIVGYGLFVMINRMRKWILQR